MNEGSPISDLLSLHPVRLIPISAVGAEFARLDSSSGEMIKQPDSECRPFNVEAPLCAVLPDLIDQADVDQKVRVYISQLQAQGPRSSRRLGAVFAALNQPKGKAFRDLVDIVLGTRFGTSLVTYFIDRLGEPGRLDTSDLEQWRCEADRRAAVLHRARAVVLAEFRATVARMETALPTSSSTWRRTS